MCELVLSLFPGIDLFGRGFEQLGFSVVRGPDLIFDQRIEDFHTPPHRFDGIIAGPPCQNYSDANRDRDQAEGDRLLWECLRVIAEAAPEWFLIENVRRVPDVAIDGYSVQRFSLRHDHCGGRTRRIRDFQFGSRQGLIIRPQRTRPPRRAAAQIVLASQMRSRHDRHCRRAAAMGAQVSLLAFSRKARRQVIGNAVPLEVARTLAAAVRARSPIGPSDCDCLCGRTVKGRARLATAACRQRSSRQARRPRRVLKFTPPDAISSNSAPDNLARDSEPC